jgi:prolipoprotein diacylglyceryltransferase
MAAVQMSGGMERHGSAIGGTIALMVYSIVLPRKRRIKHRVQNKIAYFIILNKFR